MLAIHVGIGHEHDLVIAQLGEVEVLANAGAECSDHGLDLVVAEGLVQPCPLNVQDLAAQREDGLCFRVPAALGRTAGGVTLHDVDLALFRVLRGAVRQLARHAEGLQRALAACVVAGLAGGHAGLCSGNCLADDVAGRAGIALQPVAQAVSDHALDEALDLGVAEFGLGLAFELGFRQLHGNDGGQAFADVITREVVVFFLNDVLLPRVAVNERRHGGTETLFVGSALVRVDGVGVGVDALGVCVGPLHRHFQGDFPVFVLGFEGDDVLMDNVDLLAGVQVFHVVQQAVVVLVHNCPVFGGDFAFGGNVIEIQVPVFRRLQCLTALVRQRDAQALVEERHLLEAGTQRFEVEFRALEDACIGVERLRRTGLVRLFTFDEAALGFAAIGEGHPPDVALAPHFRVHTAGKRVDHGDAHAVQAAGDGISAAAELSAGVQDGHDNLNRGLVFGGVHVHGDAAAVVHHFDAAVGLQNNFNVGAVPGQGFIHGVVHHFVHEVVETAGSRGTDVHAGAFPDSFESFKDGDVARTVSLAFGCLRRRIRCTGILSCGFHCRDICIVVSHRRFRLLCIRMAGRHRLR
ncbi:hypothetical protein D9M72_339990 [compost metagenome]